MKNEIITITTEFIRLDALLKLGGALDTGVVCVLGPRTQLEACGDLELHEL